MNQLKDIRPWNGSQDEAFEELCCQLAAREYPSSQGIFRRLRGAGGDAGVEAYWLFGDGSKHGCQVKYYFEVGDSQWRKIDESVQTAIKKHPELSTYTVCLPIDRTEGKKERKTQKGIIKEKSLVDHWNEHVAKWEGWASDEGISVQFHYWGKHEVFERLSLSEHRGRLYFWFNSEELTTEWYQARLEEALAAAGPRYTKEANVPLPITGSLDAVARTDAFYDRIQNVAGGIREALKYVSIPSSTGLTEAVSSEKVKDAYKALELSLSSWDRESFSPISFAVLNTHAKTLRDRTEELESYLRQFISERTRSNTPRSSNKGNPELERLEIARICLLRLASATNKMAELCESSDASASNTAALLVTGEAGQGKTHLFCDTAANRLQDGLGSVVLFGSDFSDDEPWDQMVKLLHLSCSNADEFAGLLEAYAEARGRRSLILIDALNEKGNRAYWQSHLPKMIQFLKKYPGVALAVSCRSSYEPIVIPEHIVPDRLVAVTHHGFSGHEAEATSIYFRRYGIEDPTVPLLRPEFSNPLFLKLFCQSMQSEGLTRVPKGLRGISATFEFFINATHKKLARLMDYDPQSDCVKRALTSVANYMGENKLLWVLLDKAKELVNSTLPGQAEYSKTLYANLLSEGLLIENVFRTDGAAAIGVRLGFERFTDHLVTRSLLSTYLDRSDPAASFHPGQVLGDLLADEYDAWSNRGWIEAMSVQVPEELGSELIDFVPHAKDWEIMQEAFLQSLVWRDPNKCGKTTDEYLNTVFQSRHENVYSTLLMLASDPEHPYNARSLHRHLQKLSMPERDYLWSIFLHHYYGNNDSMDRLLEWAWHADKSHICEESIELCGIALTWYFTTSHRFARDMATKALVSMLRSRPLVTKKLIDQFADVNDVYVSERLYATSYGVAMVTADDSAVAELAKSVYQHVFESENPVPHILLRDYARGVIEEALHRGVLPPEIDVEHARPPYQSQWPLDIPSKDKISHYGEWHKDADDGTIARNMIYGSVMGRIEGDFSHYVIGESPRWSSQRIDEKEGPNKTTADRFFGSLTKRQQKAWDTLEMVRHRVPQVLALDSESRKKYLPITDEQLQRLPRAAEDAFLEVLGKKKSAIYTQYVVPYLESESSGEFDLLMARRWILQRVFDLGWTEDMFGYFDRWFDYDFRYGRSGHKPERIGKKYQWIAFYEFFAYVADHFFLREKFGDRKTELYDNPSQAGMRDIDPSKLDIYDGPDDTQSKTEWWLPVDYVFHEATSEGKQLWTLNTEDIPSPHQLIEVTNPASDTPWLPLFSINVWSDSDRTDSLLSRPWREMWFQVRCYLVRRQHSDSVFARLKEENFFNKHVPEHGELYRTYIGEYPWASSCQKQEIMQSWTDEIDFCSKALPHPIANAVMRYGGISEYDCSSRKSINGFLPSGALCDAMELRWSRDGFSFTDSSGQIVVFDPSVQADRSSAILLSKDFCLSFLAKGEYDLIWTVLGAREYHMVDRAAYNGVISMSGAYRFENARLAGSMSEYIRSYDDADNATHDWRGRIIHQL